jgi:hypothetical protein
MPNLFKFQRKTIKDLNTQIIDTWSEKFNNVLKFQPMFCKSDEGGVTEEDLANNQHHLFKEFQNAQGRQFD